MYTLAMARKTSQLREKPFQVQEEVPQWASLEIVLAERISRPESLVGLEIEPSDSGWSAESIAEWEAEMNQFFGGDERGVANRLDRGCI